MRYEILVDHGETGNKCTIVPNSYREDFAIRRYVRGVPIAAFTSEIVLHPDGVPLDQLNKAQHGINKTEVTSLGAIDCIWRRLEAVVGWIEKPLPILVGIPEGFKTAYPRVSHDGTDPAAGLATIEALFIGAALLGHWDETLLAEYYFGERFLELNDQRFRELGVTPKARGPEPVFQPRSPRSAWKRRVSQGRTGEKLL